MAAAVADFRPEGRRRPQAQEGGRHPGRGARADARHPGRVSGARRRPGQLLVGFAAETAQPDRAGDAAAATTPAEKLAAKNIDLVVANDVAAPGVGFAHDTNAVLILGV